MNSRHLRPSPAPPYGAPFSVYPDGAAHFPFQTTHDISSDESPEESRGCRRPPAPYPSDPHHDNYESSLVNTTSMTASQATLPTALPPIFLDLQLATHLRPPAAQATAQPACSNLQIPPPSTAPPTYKSAAVA